MKTRHHIGTAWTAAGLALAAGVLLAGAASTARAEAILQVFNQSHNEIAARLPEIAEAGYTALWVPPPTKANGGMSVGYDLNDPFDIGNSDLRGTWSTRYGVEADLHNLIEMCHRFGMRVYFDNVMNHRSYDVPGYNESTPIDVYPGMCAEDFHLRTTSDGFYRKWDNVRSWDDEWQVMFLGLSDLLDIAHETPNQNFGAHEGDWHDKPKFVRHPNNPEYYDWAPDGTVVGFGPDNGLTVETLAEHPEAYSEDVGGYLCRAVRWLVDRTRVDGLRLDAVKHVPYYFFGAQNDDGSFDGYVGNVQLQFNRTRGFADRNNRDSVFDSDARRNDAMLFGEHLGAPPPQGPYVAAGMRLVDDRLRNELNWRFSANDLWGFDYDGAGSDLGSACGVMHAQSHDNDYVDRKPLHHAFYFMHKGLGLVYSDGNNHAATLTGSGGAFPRWAQTDFLGQWGQKQIPTLLHAHENFARYDQIPMEVYENGNFIAWQRGGGDTSWATMLFMLNSSWDWWQPTHVSGSFPRDAWLYDYASDMYMPYFVNEGPAADYAWGGDLQDGNVNLPNNAYAIWSWKNPDPSSLFPSPYPDCFVNTDDRVIAPDSRVITIMEDGKVVDPVMVVRKDGADGDPNFNPYNVADTNAEDYAYTIALPRVTGGTNVTLAVKADGSAERLLLRLDGGMDYGNHSPEPDPNNIGHDGWGHYWEQQSWDTEDAVDRLDWRDYPPGSAHDFFLGFEEGASNFTRRIWSEKFAAADSDYCKIGTQGATTYEIKPGETNVYQPKSKYDGPSVEAPGFVWHSPTAETEAVPKSKAAKAKVAAKAKAGSRASAEWVGKSYIFANDWYKASGRDDWDRPAFHGANLGKVSGSISFGGQCQTWNEQDGKGNPARACYNILSGGDIVKNGTATLYWYKYEDNNNWFESRDCTGEESVWQPIDLDVSDLADGQYTLSVWFEANGASTNNYDNNGGSNYNATFTIGEGGGGGGGGGGGDDDRDYGVQPQFSRNGTSATIWTKTAHTQGARAFVYYTVDGDHWPEGGGGVPANPYTKAVEGGWQCDTGSGSWWRFDLPEGSVPSGATLRYKVSAFREMGYGGNGWGTVWPGSADAIRDKKVMMSLWTVPGLDFTTQQYHKHNDYTSWTTGFKDGFHLVTARMLLNRTDGAEIANTFRQTFYLDLHTPKGEFKYPSEPRPWFGESEYGMVFKTDNTVDEVWVHVTDGDDSNDTVGNGVTTNGVEWAKATQISPWTKEDAQDTELTKLWRWTYSRIPHEGTATIRVRLREVSSAPVEEWSKEAPEEGAALEALHVTELKKVADTHGPAELFYFDWPDQDGAMVEAGWDVRIKYSTSMISGLPVDDVAGKFRVYVNATSNGSTNKGAEVAASDLNIRPGGSGWWDGDPATMVFTMPNVYNGIDGWRYALTVEFENTVDGKKYSKSATRMITHKGPLLPTCIITTPPETDSDGVKYVITMEDSTAARTNRALRETPIVVLTDAEATRLDLQFVSPTDYGAAISATWASRPTNDCLRTVSIESNGTSKTWTFAWQATNAGSYRVQATVTADNSAGKYSVPTNGAIRTATVRFRQLVHVTSTNELDDWDDDGVVNKREQENLGKPTGEPEYWTQEKIFDYYSTGKSDPDCPDSDGDGLPDGLELGYRTAADGTESTTDTNGDGWPNFIWDRDPPFYNSCESLYGKVPGVTSSTEGGDRLALVKGSTTDPRNPDSDGDGIPDGVEDANRNGWLDGDGAILPGDWDPYWDRAWPDGKMAGETWEETSPCIWDSDADGLSDGYGEDTDLDGWTDMGLVYDENGPVVPLGPADLAAIGALVDNNSSANSASTLAEKPLTSRAINYDALFAAYNVTEEGKSGTKQTNGWPRLVITETDPLCTDTDHDGLPDGWENQYSLDPLNNGVYDFRTGRFTDDPTHGPAGNPDNDTYLQGGVAVPYDNAAEYLGGTNPRSSDNREGGEIAGAITVGTGNPIGSVNGTTFYTEATQWTLGDLVALDDYNQGGNSSDIYRFGDGFDSSRDMVAFYFRDGGTEDGNLYFRVDFDDLQAFAEDNALNIYVAINFGNYGNGLDDLPDDVNCKSAMKWNAVSGVYDSQNGCLYVQDGTTYKATGGFRGAWFNSELDTVVWAIDRSVLVDAGWKLQNPDLLMFQVYTTRDFTSDDGGSGDKGGLNDFADVIGGGGWEKNDDWLCSDYWNDYNNIAQNGVYRYCVSKGNDDPHTWNNRGQHAKLAMVSHGNQAVEPGNVIQALVNNGAGAGYDRPVQIHNIYTNCPLNLHVTPTLAIALQWAEVGTENAWYSGPALNAAIRKGVANGALSLLGSTFSDHIPLYFPDDFNAANVERARAVLDEIYGGGSEVVSRKVLWSPERVADADWLVRMGRLGYRATLVDQTPHLLEWFGRQTALGNDAYKIQRYWINTSGDDWTSEDAFALSTAASGFRYANTDGGLASDLRRLFLRRARTGEAAISSIFYMWEDFADSGNADAYDRSLRWIANHPWIQVVTLDDALEDDVLANNVAGHDLSVTNGMAMQDWVHHACNGSYDNWFHGSWRHESLSGKQFEIREGKTMEAVWGTRTNGILRDAWAAVKGIQNAQVKALAEATIFASAFETAFHEEYNSDLSRWSYGEYISEANGWYWDDGAKEWKWKEMGLMPMSWHAQSRTRLAAVYAEVDAWTRAADGLRAYAKDVDLDGEDEWILRNNKVMAVFEAEGGLMTGAWYKDGTNVWQMVGNFAAQPETGYETQSATAGSTRGTAMKDITIGGTSTVAEIFGVTSAAGELAFGGSGLTKTVKLAGANATAFDISYSAPGKQMYVRNALSPDLATLMIAGQSRMTEAADGTSSLTVGTSYGGTSVNATLNVSTGAINTAATDWPEGAAWNTVKLRNAPQVRQVEVSGTGTLSYQIAFSTASISQEPPTITVTPPGDQIFPVGATTSFRVTAIDWQGTPLPVEATYLPDGPLLAGHPSWDATSGLFTWTMGPISDGSSSSEWIATAARTNDWETHATFTTRDSNGETANLTVKIVVPWDADGNGIGDDWEYYFHVYGKKARPADFKGGGDDDDDDDGFSNQSEWVAGTDPNSGDDYIGWNLQSFSPTNITYGFRSVPGGTYHIVATDIESLPTVPATNWPRVATVTATSSNTLWSTNRTPTAPDLIYGIRIPFRER